MIHTDKLTVLFDILITAINQGKEQVSIRHSHYYEDLIKCLVEEGFIWSYSIKEEMLVIFLNNCGEGHIKYQRISTPGNRVYLSADEIFYLEGFYLISTSEGIISNRSLNQLGGEVLIRISYEHA